MIDLLDLGGGTMPHPRAQVVIDLHHPRNAPAQDATVTPWTYLAGDAYRPIAPGSVAEVFSSHMMEHVPRGQQLIDVMNEAWRVLRPGGTFTIICPLVGYTDPFTGEGNLVNGWQPYADPTHVNLWWFPEALLYFCDGPFKPHADYGISEWAALGPWVSWEQATRFVREAATAPAATYSFWGVRDGWEGVARLVKP